MEIKVRTPNPTQGNVIVHLVLAVLRLVAREAQGLVGGELPDAGVDGGSKGDTVMIALARNELEERFWAVFYC